MLIHGNDINGLKVIAKQSGKQIETVKDLLFNAEKQQVVGFLLNEDMLSNGASFIDYADVESIGQDALMVDSENAIKKGSKERLSSMKGSVMLKGKQIITENGDHVGKVSDVYVDTDKGSIAQLEISEGVLQELQGGKKKIDAGNNVVKIGPDTILVRENVQNEVDQQAEDGGLSGLYQAAKEKGENALQSAQNYAEDRNQQHDSLDMEDMRTYTQSKSEPDNSTTQDIVDEGNNSDVNKSDQRYARDVFDKLKEQTKKSSEKIKNEANKLEDIVSDSLNE